jgi:2'-5' RNA ligase
VIRVGQTARVAEQLAFFFDDDADDAVRALWRKLDKAKVPSMAGYSHRKHRPQVTFAVAGSIPVKARAALKADLGMLSLPALWLYTLGTFAAAEHSLFLGAVTDTELLAVHSTVHDALAGKVRNPWAYYLPGAWVPHCTLAQDVTSDQLVTGFATIHPVEPIRAKIAEVGIVDTRTGDVEPLT